MVQRQLGVVAIVGDSGIVLAEPLTLKMEHRIGKCAGPQMWDMRKIVLGLRATYVVS